VHPQVVSCVLCLTTTDRHTIVADQPVWFVIYLFIYSRLPSVSHDGYVEKNKNKHKTKLEITKKTQMNGKQIPPPSALGFTHSGDEAPLVRK
jgi:hypothetical protein